MSYSQQWYIVKEKSGNCQIVTEEDGKTPESQIYWGPFPSAEKAIAARVGLIRAGKCQPS